MRLFFEVDDKEAAPRVGDFVRLKMPVTRWQLKVIAVKHQFDRSTVENFKSHDVLLICEIQATTAAGE